MKFFIIPILAVVICATTGAFSALPNFSSEIVTESVNEHHTRVQIDIDVPDPNGKNFDKVDIAHTIEILSEPVNEHVSPPEIDHLLADPVGKSFNIDDIVQALETPRHLIHEEIEKFTQVAGNLESAILDATNEIRNSDHSQSFIKSLVSRVTTAAQTLYGNLILSIKKPIVETIQNAEENLIQSYKDAINHLQNLEECTGKDNVNIIPDDGLKSLSKCVVDELETADTAVLRTINVIARGFDLLSSVPRDAANCVDQYSTILSIPKVGRCFLATAVNTAADAKHIAREAAAEGARNVQSLISAFDRSKNCIKEKIDAFVDKADEAGVDLEKCFQ